MTLRKNSLSFVLRNHLFCLQMLRAAPHRSAPLLSYAVLCAAQNRMTVTHMWVNAAITAADNPDYARRGTYKETIEWRALSNVAALCSRAEFKANQDEDVPLKERACTGDASEVAILKFMEFELENVQAYRTRSPKVAEIPFNSTNKFHVTVHRLDLNDPARARGYEHILLMKGAPERILERSERIFVKGAEEKMTDDWKERFNSAYEELVREFGVCVAKYSTYSYTNTV